MIGCLTETTTCLVAKPLVLSNRDIQINHIYKAKCTFVYSSILFFNLINNYVDMVNRPIFENLHLIAFSTMMLRSQQNNPAKNVIRKNIL